MIRQIGFLNIGVFTAVIGSRNLQLLGIGSAVFLAVAGLAGWWRFTYGLEATDEGDQVVTLSGILSRNRTSVPLERIQSVSTRQNLLHRITNLVEVKVQTAGSSGSEVELPAVSIEIADRIRRLSTATRTSGERVEIPDGVVPPRPDTDPLLRRSLGEILVVAFTRNPIVLLAPIPLAIGLGFEAEELLGDRIEGLLSSAGSSTAATIITIIVVLVLSAAFSVTLIVLRFFDLRLFADGVGLRRLAGLLSRTEVTASFERVQVVATKMNPIERWLDLRELVLPVAGGRAADLQATPTSLQLPGSKPAEVERIAELLLGSGRHRTELTNGISPLAIRRWTLWGGAVPAITAAVGLWFALGWWSLAFLTWLPIMWVTATYHQRGWRWSLGAETLVVRNGVIGEHRREMPVRKAQNVIVQQGLFHRRFGLGDVSVRTASNVILTIPLLPLAQAQAIRDEVLYRAETDPRPFM